MGDRMGLEWRTIGISAGIVLCGAIVLYQIYRR